MAINRASAGERYRHKWTGDVAEVLNVTGTTVFLRWSNGVKSSMSTAQFIRLFTYHIPLRLQQVATFETDEFEGIRIGHVYTHKGDYRNARVKDFYEKGGVVFVTYVWSDDHKSGARPVQSFKDTFEGFQWNDYEHYVRPGWRFVDKETRECITVLHVLDDGERIKYEYIKKPVKRTNYLWDFWQKFRPYAGREADLGPTGSWLAIIFDVNSASVWDTKHTTVSLEDLTTTLDQEIPGLLERNQGIRITVLSLPSEDIIYDDYVDEFMAMRGKPDQAALNDFVKALVSCGNNDLIASVTKAVMTWKPVNLYSYIDQRKRWLEFRGRFGDEHWIDKIVSVEKPVPTPKSKSKARRK
jgi:hypothetical protein